MALQILANWLSELPVFAEACVERSWTLSLSIGNAIDGCQVILDKLRVPNLYGRLPDSVLVPAVEGRASCLILQG